MLLITRLRNNLGLLKQSKYNMRSASAVKQAEERFIKENLVGYLNQFSQEDDPIK